MALRLAHLLLVYSACRLLLALRALTAALPAPPVLCVVTVLAPQHASPFPPVRVNTLANAKVAGAHRDIVTVVARNTVLRASVPPLAASGSSARQPAVRH